MGSGVPSPSLPSPPPSAELSSFLSAPWELLPHDSAMTCTSGSRLFFPLFLPSEPHGQPPHCPSPELSQPLLHRPPCLQAPPGPWRTWPHCPSPAAPFGSQGRPCSGCPHLAENQPSTCRWSAGLSTLPSLAPLQPPSLSPPQSALRVPSDCSFHLKEGPSCKMLSPSRIFSPSHCRIWTFSPRAQQCLFILGGWALMGNHLRPQFSLYMDQVVGSKRFQKTQGEHES